MAQGKSKALQYIIIGVPIAIGLYFIYKAIKKPTNKKEEVSPIDPNKPEVGGGNTSGGGTSGGGTTYTPKETLPFKKGSSGKYVELIQSRLGIAKDGKFGNQTDSSVRSFQKTKGLVVDGIVGSKTWNAMFNADFPSTGVTFANNTPTKYTTDWKVLDPRSSYNW
jgi:peptidoglycan hydrolase-like protein with peptidoglycan-binding domain